MTKQEFINKTKGKVIASLLAEKSEDTFDASFQVGMARAVIAGGIEVLRCSRPEHIKEVKKNFANIPMIGWAKEFYDDSKVFITPTKREIDSLVLTGIECIAIDATIRSRPNGESLSEIVEYTRRKYPNILLMADCSTKEELLYAQELGFDLLATTLTGATDESKGNSNPKNNFEFPKLMAKKLSTPLIVEGGVSTPSEVKELLSYVHAVVIGSAITRPALLAKKFVEATK